MFRKMEKKLKIFVADNNCFVFSIFFFFQSKLRFTLYFDVHQSLHVQPCLQLNNELSYRFAISKYLITFPWEWKDEYIHAWHCSRSRKYHCTNKNILVCQVHWLAFCYECVEVLCVRESHWIKVIKCKHIFWVLHRMNHSKCGTWIVLNVLCVHTHTPNGDKICFPIFIWK